MELTRRSVIASSVAIAAVAALPAVAFAADQTAPLVADMFYTEDEPWGAFVRAHVPKEQFEKSILRMLETNDDHRENAEDWLFEYQYVGDDEEERIRVVDADPEYMHMRVDYDCPDRGEQYVFCKGGDPGAIPITVIRY